MEEVLLAVGRLAGRGPADGPLSVAVVKHTLRMRGADGARLASCLDRLSKLRNTTAHPDIAIAHNMAMLAKLDVPVAAATSCRRRGQSSLKMWWG